MIRHRRPPRAALLEHRTYGGWGVQRPEHGTLGRYSPDMTKLLPDGRTFALTLRLDRAAYQLYREVGASHEQALHNSLLCPSFAGLYNATARGVWEFELKAPGTDRVELVAMLWPQNDREWPRGELNLLEGRVGTGRTMTNLHWSDIDGVPQHDPAMIDLDVSQWHRYRVEVLPGRIRWFVDGRTVRTLETHHAPIDTPVHMVVQAGVSPAIRGDWHDNFEWEQAILFRPLRAPRGGHLPQ